MSKKIINILPLFVLLFVISYFTSCSKKGSTPDPVPPPPNTDLCLGKTITVTATPVASAPCSTGGSITASATGSTGFTYKLNSTGVYQASGVFANVAAGAYTVFAKDIDGCEKTTVATVAAAGNAGPLFTAVRNLMTNRCQSCHNNNVQNGGKNWQVDCNIVTDQGRIKIRAVDQGTMPTGGPLPQAEKDIITNWINGGGRFTD